MNKTRKSLTNKLLLFAIFVAILVGKLLFAAFLLFTAKNALAALTASDELSRLLNNMHTFQATFKQYLINNQGTIIGEQTKGTTSISRPGKFRWQTNEPNKQLILINNNNHYIYDADLEQLVKRKVNYRDPLNPAMLLTSPIETLKKSFAIVKLATTREGIWFKLTPKMQGNSYQWIKMHFTHGKLDTMQIADNLGQKSVINFGNLIFNTPLSKKIFTFTPPPNTDIFETE